MLKRLSFALAVLFCIFHCWTAMFGAAAGIGQKAIHLGLVLIIFFLDYLAQEDRKWLLPGYGRILYSGVGGQSDLHHVHR